MEKNQSSVSADDLSRYKKQLHFIQEIIKTFESIPGGGEPEDDKKKIIVDLMQQMQDCGNPPDEITKELNESGIQDFISGNINGTTAAGAMPTGVPPECAQM